MLQIQLLGGFHLTYDGEPVTTLHQGRLQSLLAYLLLHRHAPQPREHVAFRLWPDSTEAQAKTNLRRELHHLRRLLPSADLLLKVDGPMIGWRTDGPFQLDVAGFEALLATAQTAEAGTMGQVDALQRATELYGGPLLPGCYEEWLLPLREALDQQFVAALGQLVDLLEEQRAYAEAIQAAERLLRHDRLHETTYRQLMRLYVLHGDRAHALRLYHECTLTLQQELGVAPSDATQAVYAALLQPESTTAPEPAPIVPDQAALVGRQREWQMLLAAWQHAHRGHPLVALISGEAGIGKSRLAEELLVWANRQGLLTAKARAYAAEGDLAYGPIADLLRTEELRARWSKLGDVWLRELMRLLPEVREERPDLPLPEPLAESWQRRHFLEALARAVLAGDEPRLLLLDDWQWCDADTLAWVQVLLRFAPRARLLVVGTARAEEMDAGHPVAGLRLSLQHEDQWREIELGPLAAEETAALAAQVAAHKLTAAQSAAIYQQTEGNPLFVVETVRAGLAANVLKQVGVTVAQPPEHHAQAMPPKVYAVIQARLAQLSPLAQGLAALAATIGRSFTFPVLAAAGQLDEVALSQQLDELWRRRIIRAQGVNAYDFSHDRIREAAYTGISPIQRPQLHRRIAEALAAVYAEELDTVAAQLAAHYEQAGLPEQAVDYYERAAEAAQQVYAHADATGNLARGLALLERLPATPERLRQELRLQLALGISVSVLKGMSDMQAKEVYERVQTLAVQVGDDRQRLLALEGLYNFYMSQGQVQMAYDLALQTVKLAEQMANPSRIVDSQGKVGVAALHLGRLTSSRTYLEWGIGDRDYQWRDAGGPVPYQHLGLADRRHLAMALWLLGYPDQALAQIEETVTLAEELGHPYTLAASLNWAVWLHQVRREPQLAQAQAETANALYLKYGFPYWLSHSNILLGWALAQQGQVEAGIALIQQSLAARQSMDAHLRQPAFLALLAEAYGLAGQPAQGLHALDQALRQVEMTDERFSEAELYRLQGKLLRQQGAEPQVVEASLLRGLAIARQQEAKSLELRTAVALARLWQEQEKCSPAYDLLAAVYGWFTEGFDTPDLQDAKRLLDELAPS
jgi:DNA-binding SARP family transcriptional activator/predicted ATPase